MKSPQWTPNQRLAIETVGRDVLVSASAGTGKTAVLAQRCAQRVLDERRPVDVDRLLVLTYTDAAAEEMRSRIDRTLRGLCRGPGAGALRRQLLLLDASWISTFHSFCRRVIAEHFYLLDLSPRFSIIDPDQRQLLQAQCLASALEEAWETEELATAMRGLFDQRNVQPFAPGSFVNQLIDIQEFLESVPDRQGFYANACGDGQAARLAEAQRMQVLRALETMRRKVTHSLELDRAITGGDWLSGFLAENYLAFLDQCAQAADRPEALRDLIREVRFRNFPRRPKTLDEATADLVKGPAKAVKDELKGLLDLACLNPLYERRVAPHAEAQTRTLLQLAQRYEECYRRAKEQLGGLDFADLEHWMLRLLTEHPEVGEKLRSRFEYVFIDEFQDINAVQKRILDAVRRPDNLFIVGDVKQSIYAFRRSKPQIFLEALAQAAPEASAPGPLRVDLGENFRSRREILDFANAVFGRIMCRETASMEYDAGAMLRAGLEPESKPDHPAVELFILEEEAAETDDGEPEEAENDGAPALTISALQRQAAFIAGRIREIVGADTGRAEFQIYDKSAQCVRDVTYRDIVVLMRSVAHRAQEYTEILQLAGVPVSSQSSCGYFAATEISDCLSLLKVLDNPIRDIELAAVLRSAFFRCTDSQLAEIRLFADRQEHKNISYYEALRLYAERGPDGEGRRKVRAALEQLDAWREAIRTGSLSEVLGRLLEETGYIAFMSALPNGRQRRANLMKLHDRAIQFEHFGSGPQSTSLARFVEFLEKLMDQQQDWAPAQPDSAAENAVRILSVHRSKGLEFPVVFLAELNTPFNVRDLGEACLVDEDALGLKIVDPQSRALLATMAHQVLCDRKRQTMLEEEMRILYVALTRAREKLILTACGREGHCRQILEPAALRPGGRPPAWKLLEVRCGFDWILHGLSNQPGLMKLYDYEVPPVPDGGCFMARRIGRERLDEITQFIEEIKRSRKRTVLPVFGREVRKQAEALYERIQENVNWKYPNLAAASIPAKLSVSELVKQGRSDEGDFLGRVPEALLEGAGEKTASPSQVGTATHLVLSRIDLSDVSESSIRDLIDKLVKEGLVSPAAAAQVDIGQILEYFASDLGLLVRQNAAQALREWPFTFTLPACELYGGSCEERVILQGMIDLIVPTPEGLVVIDFKTDRVGQSGLAQRVEHYTPQLYYYCRAASGILNKPVCRAYLYFLSLGAANQIAMG